MDIKGIHHIAIITGDYERSKRFYTEILGFTIVKETFRKERNSYKLDLAIHGLYQIELFSFPDYLERASFPEAKGLRHLAFAVENVDAAASELRANGVEVQGVRTDEITNKQFCFFSIPTGSRWNCMRYNLAP
jgi:glyoxylase I family protein